MLNYLISFNTRASLLIRLANFSLSLSPRCAALSPRRLSVSTLGYLWLLFAVCVSCVYSHGSGPLTGTVCVRWNKDIQSLSLFCSCMAFLLITYWPKRGGGIEGINSEEFPPRVLCSMYIRQRVDAPNQAKQKKANSSTLLA